MPKVQFDLTTISGAIESSKFQEAMAAALPFDKRHVWLISRGWKDRGLSADTRRHLYSREELWNGAAINQTKAVLVECFRIMEEKGLVIRSK